MTLSEAMDAIRSATDDEERIETMQFYVDAGRRAGFPEDSPMEQVIEYVMNETGDADTLAQLAIARPPRGTR